MADHQPNVQQRCVFILGKTGGGKSTIGNMIAKYDPMAGENPPFAVSDNFFTSVTRDVREATSEFTRGDTEYRVKIIDTVGLFDVSTNPRSNSSILNQVEEYFNEHNIAGVNLILFVCRKSYFTQDEKAVFSFIRSKFSAQINSISALVITGFEGEDNDKRKEFVRKFQSQSGTEEIANQMKKGIIPVGFPPVRKLDQALQQAYEQPMQGDKEKLFELIASCEKVELKENLFQKSLCSIL